MTQCVASYRLDGRRVEVWRGDALSLSAGVVVFGRNRALRTDLQAAVGSRFERSPHPTVHGRKFDLLEVDPEGNGPPWQVAVSLDYRPRAVRVDACQTPPNLTHIDKLSDDLWWVIAAAVRRLPGAGSREIMLLPLSCRNPEVIAVAEVLAIWSAIADGLPFWQETPMTYRLIDVHDPSPFVNALQDRDAITSRALRAGVPACLRDGVLERWEQHRFQRE